MLTPINRKRAETQLTKDFSQPLTFNWLGDADPSEDNVEAYDSQGNYIDTIMISLNEEGTLEYTTTSDWQTTLPIE